MTGMKLETFTSSALDRSQTSTEQADFQGKKESDEHKIDNSFP